MSDVTALVLSVGEDYTERAIASVQRQTLPVAEVIVVQGISPFYRALNSGAARVRTEFFIQVDADMILDDTCVEDLRRSMAERVGLVVGHLQDPLQGRILGIKLFRTQCFERVQLRESLSPETDFVEDIQQEGWTRIYALKKIGGSSSDWHVFGEHRPDYNRYYTFCKYMREGAKGRYRKTGGGLRGKFQRLHASSHRSALFAIVAAAHGIFVKENRDLYGPFEHSEGFEFLEQFLNDAKASPALPAIPDGWMQRDFRKGFKQAYAGGIQLRWQQAPSTFMAYVKRLGQEESIAAWVTLVGLCHGLFMDAYHETEAEAAFAQLHDLLPR